MNKVRMTQAEFDSVIRVKSVYKLSSALKVLAVDNNFSVPSGIPLNRLSEEKVAAAYYFPELCEIEPEYENISGASAVAGYLNGESIQWQHIDKHSQWHDLSGGLSVGSFKDCNYKFRRKKSCPDQKS
ncbi:hypothetical protein KP77_25330 [Jeotgalibacillus alimentarius]|uniref:Uncharacterized protein n=1 Tax=Jeotgalibacillus alimentarius TaxID=135826 RepID=A0A0C2RYT4_9BACL|nr:hypothetical protein [Jeotgalibacillus alimentarius]KIL46964.1 hypothetical protein KP77_25330 [Jeotgalibacillus alimentarius]